MPRQTQLIRIFLASPGDVAKEREAARRIIAETNRSVAAGQGVVLQIVGWETDTIPQLGGDPQSIVNAQIVNSGDYDLFIGIMWNRFGSPTPRAGSGTEEEFRQALDLRTRTGRPDIMFYFSKVPASLDQVDQLDQKRKVVEFRKEVESMGLIGTYESADDFADVFREHLHRWLMGLHPVVPNPPSVPLRPPATEPSTGTASAHHEPQTTQTEWLLLKDRFFRCESVVETDDSKIVAELPSPPPEEEAVLRSFQTQQVWGKQPALYAYQNDGGMVSVQSAERISKGGRTVWKLTLTLDRGERRNLMTEISFNGVTPLQIAEMRARLLLLDEKPQSPKGASRDSMLELGIAGISNSIKIKAGIFPELWERFQASPELFPEFARLWAVFYLKASFTVEHIFQLDIGRVQNGSVSVNFRGQRPAFYTNQPPDMITVTGVCRLA